MESVFDLIVQPAVNNHLSLEITCCEILEGWNISSNLQHWETIQHLDLHDNIIEFLGWFLECYSEHFFLDWENSGVFVLLAKILQNTPNWHFIHIICNVEEYFAKISLDGESVSTGPVTGEDHLQREEDLLLWHDNIVLGDDFHRCDKFSWFILSLDQERCFLFSSILMNKSVVNSNIEDSLKNILCIEGHVSLDCHHIIYSSKSVLLQGDDDGLQEWCFLVKQLPDRESGFLQRLDDGF